MTRHYLVWQTLITLWVNPCEIAPTARSIVNLDQLDPQLKAFLQGQYGCPCPVLRRNALQALLGEYLLTHDRRNIRFLIGRMVRGAAYSPDEPHHYVRAVLWLSALFSSCLRSEHLHAVDRGVNSRVASIALEFAMRRILARMACDCRDERAVLQIASDVSEHAEEMFTAALAEVTRT